MHASKTPERPKVPWRLGLERRGGGAPAGNFNFNAHRIRRVAAGQESPAAPSPCWDTWNRDVVPIRDQDERVARGGHYLAQRDRTLSMSLVNLAALASICAVRASKCLKSKWSARSHSMIESMPGAGVTSR